MHSKRHSPTHRLNSLCMDVSERLVVVSVRWCLSWCVWPIIIAILSSSLLPPATAANQIQPRTLITAKNLVYILYHLSFFLRVQNKSKHRIASKKICWLIFSYLCFPTTFSQKNSSLIIIYHIMYTAQLIIKNIWLQWKHTFHFHTVNQVILSLSHPHMQAHWIAFFYLFSNLF